MSNFENARDFRINHLAIYSSSSTSKTALAYLHDNSAIGALHNSYERCDAPQCHAETRVAVQEEILSWITHGDRDSQPKKIMWISGPAGAGKTAIAGTVAETCQRQGLLAASFFFSSFSGSKERRSKKRLIATIAYQLLQHEALQDVGRQILSVIDKNPAIFETRLKNQLEELILKPLRDYQPTTNSPQVIIVDGLDEVEHDHTKAFKEDVHLEILNVLIQAVADPAFPFRILVVSRPERVMRSFFSQEAEDLTLTIFLDEKYDPDTDITLFLKSKFSEIRRRYILPPTWPTEVDIRQLVENASGQFIYAATVLRFIQDPRSLPQAQLDCVLSLQFNVDGSNPFGPLDALYSQILKGSPNPKRVICWIEAMKRGSQLMPGLFWRQFLENTPGESEYLFGNLSSLISVPAPGDPSSRYQLYHKSFGDFTSDQSRCGDLFVPVDGRDGYVFHFEYRFLQILKNKGPIVPITGAELRDFLSHFFSITVNPNPQILTRDQSVWDPVETSWASRTMPKEDILACDVVWWVRKAIEHIPLAQTSESLAAGRFPQVANTIAGFFWHIHSSCPSYHCRPTCKYWRPNIIQVCKELGWVVPGKLDLFRNRFVKWSPVLSDHTSGTRLRFPWPGPQNFIPPG